MTLPTGRRLALLKLKQKNSFTLIELLLVVIILGILAGMGAPAFRKTYLNLELNNTANNLAFLMRYAQGRCVVERTIYRLNFDSERKRCWLTKQSIGAAESFEKVSSKFSRSIIFPKEIKVESELEAVNFYPDGKIDSVNIYLKYKNDRTLIISTEGQIGYVEVLDFKS